MCVTVLFKDTVYPIIRFNTMDVSEVLPGPGSGGLNFRRVAGFLGRSDNMVKLRGVNVYPTGIGEHLRDAEGTTGEYVCRVERQGHRDEMTVVVELSAGVAADEARRLELAGMLRQRLGVDVAVELVGPGGTAPLTEIEQRQKPIRLLDRRPK
jgi:phenylacetate-CoA ligase